MKDRLTGDDLGALPDAFVVVRRRQFRLTLYTRHDNVYKRSMQCPVAVGAAGFGTPGGAFMVQRKARHPDWLMPNSSWVPEGLRGTVVPGGHPDNPIREAFLQLTADGIGIHGTASLLSLKSRASHGCIRVAPHRAIQLYEQVSVGSPVYVT